MIENKPTYIPMATRILIQMNEKKEKNGILLPDGVSTAALPVTATVVAIGDMVNQDKFHLDVGDTVCLSLTPAMRFPMDKEGLIIIERVDVIAKLSKNV